MHTLTPSEPVATPAAINSAESCTGVVIKKIIGNYHVVVDGRTIVCGLSNRLYERATVSGGSKPSRRNQAQATSHPEPVVIGDKVKFISAPDGVGLITELLPRRNKLARRSAVPMPSARPYEQVIVANIDQVIPVFAAANPTPKWNLLDRYLVSAEAAGLPATICITKLDLASSNDAELWQALDDYRHIGYPVVQVSALTGEGLDDLRQALLDSTSVLLGKSGVGKTTLLNALQPGLGLRVNAVSQVTGKGKHTTTNQEMFSLDFGGRIVDTPGVREFGLWDVDEGELAWYFPEMRPFIGKCRFGMDCQHDEEPGCAIRSAVMAGEISPRRYRSLSHLRDEL